MGMGRAFRALIAQRTVRWTDPELLERIASLIGTRSICTCAASKMWKMKIRGAKTKETRKQVTHANGIGFLPFQLADGRRAVINREARHAVGARIPTLYCPENIF